MRNFTFIFFIFMLSSAISIMQAQGTWSQTNLSEAKTGMGTASLGSKVYFAGGYTAPDGEMTTKVEVYDINTQTWSATNLSVGRKYPAGVTNGSKIFFAGGANLFVFPPIAFGTIDILNTLTNTWSVANLSIPRFNVAAASYDNQVLFAGGANVAVGTAYNVVDIYNVETDTWTTASLSEGRVAMATAVAEGKAFFAGGFNLSTVTNRVDIYDFSNQTWTTASLSEARGFAAATAVGTKVIFAGGMKANNTPSNRVDIYDIATNEWTTASLSVARAFFVTNGATACGKAFFGGGGSFDLISTSWVIGSASNMVDIYNAQTNEWSTSQLTHQTIEHGVVANGNRVFFAGGSDMAAFDFLTVDIYTCTPVVGMEEQIAYNNNLFSLYPNPTTGNGSTQIRLTATQGQPYTLSIVNPQGQMVCTPQTVELGNAAITLPQLTAGLYFVNLTSGNNTQALKWVVQ